uniref:Uncharacterized protein n=1 Tax=Oryza glumipatula TaxID=40148 RepID=A0A0D9ZVB5_9ORYZ
MGTVWSLSVTTSKAIGGEQEQWMHHAWALAPPLVLPPAPSSPLLLFHFLAEATTLDGVASDDNNTSDLSGAAHKDELEGSILFSTAILL